LLGRIGFSITRGGGSVRKFVEFLEEIQKIEQKRDPEATSGMALHRFINLCDLTSYVDWQVDDLDEASMKARVLFNQEEGIEEEVGV
jgi:hypothetical protein